MRLLVTAGLLAPGIAFAHAFVQPYTMPVPFSMYAFGAAAALVLSFVMIGAFASVPVLSAGAVAAAAEAPRSATLHPWVRGGRAVALMLLVLAITAGLAGTQNAFTNINMTLFWILFVLGMPYATILCGDVFALMNPWRSLANAASAIAGREFRGRAGVRLGYTPAVLLYMAFIWLELFGNLRPFGLSIVLLIYSVVNIAGAWYFGTEQWFRRGEFFGLSLRLIGAMAPLQWRSDGRVSWQRPLVGLSVPAAERRAGLTLFVLFMLSSTAYDGLHSTLPWVSIFWKGLYPAIGDWISTAPGRKFVVSTQMYYGWQWASLLLSPLVYWGVFAVFVGLIRATTRTSDSVSTMVCRFALTLVPIAFVYHVTHYYTLLLAQGGQVIRLISDPFGLGWDLFGTAKLQVPPIMVSVNAVWHTQVALILLGHVASVYLAHIEALRLFRTPRLATLSQLPLLVLMVMFTAFGLWILSLPLAAGGG